MGGTSTDIALLQGGEATLTGEKTVGIARVALPALDIHTLGAGGGSIAWVDAGRILRVGPQSAGADPGPAGYGRGGTAPTVTDANLVRGLLDPGNFLGGRIRLDVAAAQRAIAPLAKALGTDALAAAEGIARVVLSAWGMLATDLRYELVRSHVSDVRRLIAAALRRLFASLEKEGRRRLGRFDGPIEVRRALDMRYGEQIFEITVDLAGVDLARADLLDEIAARFHRRHEELYAYSAPGQEVVIVNARVAVVGRLPVLPADEAVATGRALAPPARRRVWLGGWTEIPVYRLDALGAGHEVKGPALFESATTTVLVREDERAAVTPRGWLDIALG